MTVLALLLVYSMLILLASLLGGSLSSLIRMTHLRTQLLMSGVGGLMLGIAMLHLLPHGTDLLGSAANAGTGALIGLTVMFLLIRLFHTHDHSVTSDPNEPCQHDHHEHHEHVHQIQFEPTRGHHHDHAHDHHKHAHHEHAHDHHHSHHHSKGISWTGLFFGLLLHTLVDGVALAASVMAEGEHGAWLGLGGLGTFLAVALHKPLDTFAITSVMRRQRWSLRSQWIASTAFSLACPAGALAFYFGTSSLVTAPNVLGWGLAASAGFFIGIALADLLPEVAFHDHDRGKLTAVFLLGICLAVCIEHLPGHKHPALNFNTPALVFQL